MALPQKWIRGPGGEGVQASLLLLLALLILFWPALFSGRVLLPADMIYDLDPLWQPLAPAGYAHPANPILSDQVYQFFPWQVFAHRSLAQGQLPLWNPYTDGGLPFVGNAQSALFSPFRLPGYLLPLYPAYVVTAILRLFVAGLFTFLFARQIGLSRPGALLAMVTFAFSGPLIVWLGHPHSLVIVWLPAALLAIERAIARRSSLYVLLSGLAIGAQFLGGHPETSFHLMLAWTAYALFRAISMAGWRPAWNSLSNSLSRLLPQLARIAVAAAIGASLAAVQLLPLGEALLHSATLSARRAEAFSGASTFLARLFCQWHDWPTAITAFLPHYFGSDLDGSYWYPYSNSVEQNMYAGVLPLALAITATLHYLRRPAHTPTRHPAATPKSPRRRLVLFLASLAVACLGIALRMPLLNAINELPLFNLAANGRLRMIYAFALAILAGLGLDEISAGDRHSRRTTLRILALLALASLCLAGLAYAGLVIFRDQVLHSGRAFMEAHWGSPYFTRPLEDYNALVEERYAKKLALFGPGNVVMYLPVLIALAWAAWHRCWPRRRRAWASAAVGLTMLDLLAVGMPFNPAVPADQIFPTPGAIQFLQQDRDVYRVSGTDLILYPNSGMLFGMHDIRGYDVVVSRRYAALIDRLEGHYRLHAHSLFTQATAPLFDLLNVKYVLTDQELDGRWELAYIDQGSVRVYRNRDVLPRAFLVYDAEVVEDAAQSLERVVDGRLDWRKKVVLEEMPAGWAGPPAELATAPAVGCKASARIVDYQPNRVRLHVETPAAGLLVLTDTYAPGWQALQDGQAVPVYVANHAFRAVVVPAGRHAVAFVYRPQSLQIGVWISLLSALATAAALALVLLASRTRQQRDTGR